MKKVILGTTALVAASALTAGSASAAEKIKLNVGGYLQTSFVAASYDEPTGVASRLPTNIRHEGEVFFSGKTTLDNGLEFGVNIQLEARQSTDQVDETYMWVEGSFGRVNVGSEDSASYLMHYSSPSPVPAWGLSSPNANAAFGGGLTPSTLTNELGDTDKLTYFTPRFSGFQLGASYTPDARWQTGTGANSPYAPNQAEGDGDEAYSVSANYNNKFDAVSIKASVGFQTITRSDTARAGTSTTTFAVTSADVTGTTAATTGATTTTTAITSTASGTAGVFNTSTVVSTSTAIDDTDEFDAGLTVGFGGFSIGAAYKYTDNDSGVKGTERDDFNVGVTYGQGPWKIGVQYAGVRLETSAATANEGDIDAVVVGGQYVLGPGITAFGGVQFWEADGTAVSSTLGENATVFFVGTSLSF
jgi:outer membrane protein OmpU